MLLLSEIKPLLTVLEYPQVSVSERSSGAPARSSCNEPELHEKRFADLLQRHRLLSKRGSQRFQPDRTAVVALDYHFQKPPVKPVKT